MTHFHTIHSHTYLCRYHWQDTGGSHEEAAEAAVDLEYAAAAAAAAAWIEYAVASGPHASF